VVPVFGTYILFLGLWVMVFGWDEGTSALGFLSQKGTEADEGGVSATMRNPASTQAKRCHRDNPSKRQIINGLTKKSYAESVATQLHTL
jgi:hypothetical protein